MSNTNKGTRARLLSGAGTAVLATFLVTGAHAADTIIDQDGTPTVSATADLAINSPQENNGAVSAVIAGATGTVDQSGSEDNTTNNTSISTEDNMIAAQAIGNNNVSSIPALAEIGTNGAAILNTSINQAGGLGTETGIVTSSVTDSVIANQLVDFETGALSTSGNTISADTTLNSGSSLISGTVPLDFSSATAGTSTLNYSDDGDQFNAAGTLVASSVQQAIGTGQGAGSSASVVDNEIRIDLNSSADNTVTAAPIVDANAIAATFTGNSARNTIDIQEGGSPSFAGSAVVSNLQLNAADAASDADSVAAYNSGSRIGVEIGSASATNSLEGAVTVTGNSISSAATGNEALGSAVGTAGNRILLGDGMAIAGTAGTASASTEITYNGGGVDSSVAADLVIHNSQGNVAAGGVNNRIDSVTEDSELGTDIQSLAGSRSRVAGNRVTATTTGNAASSAIATGENTGAFSASVALANQQTNDGVDIEARNSISDVGTWVGLGDASTNDTSLFVTSNRVLATAYGNQVTQQVGIDANSIALSGDTDTVTLSSGTGPDGRVEADGAVTVSNLQSRYNSATTATNEGSRIGATAWADDTNGSTLAVTSNRQEAVAAGASASNGLSLVSGTTLGSGAGIANVQIGDADSPVTAELDGAEASAHVDGDLADSRVLLANNIQRAIGYGNSASNALNATGTTTTPALADEADVASAVSFDQDASGGLVFNNDPSNTPTVNAAFGLLNDQSVQANVQATASDGELRVSIGEAVDDSTIANVGNTLVAAALGNDVENSLTLDPGTLTTGEDGGFASVANVTNVQAVGGDAAAIRAEASGGNVVLTTADDVDDSSVFTSRNTIQALASGNSSVNQVAASATGISTRPDIEGDDEPRGSASLSGGSLITDAAFSVQNAQSGQGSVTATQRDGGTAAQVRVSVDDVSDSRIAADANVSTASATSNSAINSLLLDANSLATTGAVQNFQTTSADVSALIGQQGVQGVPASPGGPFSFEVTAVTPIGGIGGPDGVTDLSGTLAASTDGMNADLLAFLLDNGWELDSEDPDTIVGDASVLGTISGSAFAELISPGGTALVDGTLPGTGGTPGLPNQGGVSIATGDLLINSTLSVSDNSTRGSVVGNNASNTLAATGAQIADGSGATESRAGVIGLDDDDNSVIGAAADHALVNFQSVESDSLTSDVAGTFAIDADASAVVSNATLSVSGNSQSASAVANTAGNNLTVGDANTANLSAGSALLSVQSSDAAVSASSDAELFAPGAVTNSTVALSDNTNSSLAVINDVTNTVSVAAANIDPVDGPANVNLVSGPANGAGTATGDHVLANRQDASTSVSSTATTRLYNQDETATETTGLANSSLSIAGNVTAAEASANRALNTLDVAGGASNGANAGIGNFQVSDAGVTAEAYTSATVRLAGTPDDDTPIAALNGSSASISGNSTTALARGNSATNVLNATAGANYGGSVGAANVSGGEVSATAGVLNNQANFGGVQATAGSATPGSVSVSYQVALNGPGTDQAISNGSVSVTGNQAAAEAYGNSATNRVNLTALNTSAPSAAVGNYQLNAGSIKARATSVTFGVTGVGAANGSTLRNAGNQVTATAVGNSAVSTIAAQ